MASALWPVRRGVSLVELLVALLLLEILGVSALAAILTAERINRHATLAGGEDVARWRRYHEAEMAPGCADSLAPQAIVATAPATAERPPLMLALLCGR